MHLVLTQAEAILLAKMSVHRIWLQNLNERHKFTFTLKSISLRETHTAETHGKKFDFYVIIIITRPWPAFGQGLVGMVARIQL